jgi:hypothetical protein
MKLRLADLRVSSFETAAASVIQLPHTSDPTAQTYCDWCPLATEANCW